jgi:hypothetical protein
LLEGITDVLGPKAMLEGDIFFILSMRVSSNTVTSISNPKGIGMKMWKTHIANSSPPSSHTVSTTILAWEGCVWAIFFGDFAKPLDDVTGSNFICLHLDKDWDAFFVKHIANQTNEGTIFQLDGCEFENDANVLPVILVASKTW